MARYRLSLVLSALAPAALATADHWEVDKQTSCDGKQVSFSRCEKAACAQQCQPADCVFAAWNDWSSSDCTGLCERQRSVAEHNNECGEPCRGPMIETKRCPTTCHKPPVDCEFSDWTPWRGLSSPTPCSGDEQQKMRTRDIITQPELHGGKACSGSTKQTVGCIPPAPQDCVLSDWSGWSECSVTCGDGQTVRTKQIVQNAFYGGKPCEGQMKETKECRAATLNATGCPTSVDCVWGDWNPWSACTCSCAGGQTTRDRIIRVAPKGNGELCDPNDRTQIAPCNTQACDEEQCTDGKWGDWGSYGQCSAPCGGGVMWRSRPMAVEASECGTPAVGVDKEVVPCNQQSCSPDIPCEFSDWSDWGDCSCTKDGVKRRVRAISAYGKGKGAWCVGDLKEISPCNTCNETGTCEAEPVPEDCELSGWAPAEGSKGICSVTCGTGQIESVRTIIKEAANGGKPCEGSMSKIETCTRAECAVPEGPKPCVWGDWMPWGACDKCGGQRKRNRQILSMPEDGGEPCQLGASEETKKCPRMCHEPAYCEWSEWSDQGACSTSCGKGFLTKLRYLKPKLTTRRLTKDISEVQMAGAAECEGRQMQRFDCSLAPCVDTCVPINCTLGDWSAWSSSDCTGLCERHRGVANPNNECGMPCKDSLIETKRCPTTCHKTPVDCVFGSWSAWFAESEVETSLACQGTDTQKIRKRPILTEAANGGVPCSGEQKEIADCPPPPVEDCAMSDWSQWSVCSAECGQGQKHRTRTVTSEASMMGSRCRGDLTDTAPCELKPCTDSVDCLWNDWSQWSACTCSCGGGQKTRDRIIKQSPRGDGQLCSPHDRTELAACSTEPCSETICIDGKWGDWSPLGLCSAKCGGGLQWRTRRLVTEANACGKPAEGIDRQAFPCNTQSCSANVDCQLGDWSDWGACSCTLDGVKRRVRAVAQYGSGQGAWCNGDLKQIAPCNTCTEKGTCEVVPDPEPCVFSSWIPAAGTEGLCSKSCGGGQKQEVRTYSGGTHGAKPCDGSLSRTIPCNVEPCPVHTKGNPCVWGQWLEWGACDKCGGQRKRSRQILAMPEDGGEPCLEGASEEMEKCPRHCHDTYFCEWSAWEAEGECSVTCGVGTQKKARYLKATVMPTPTILNDTNFSELYRDAPVIEDNSERIKDVVLAFGCGGLVSLAAFMVVLRRAAHAQPMSGGEDRDAIRASELRVVRSSMHFDRDESVPLNLQ